MANKTFGFGSIKVIMFVCGLILFAGCVTEIQTPMSREQRITSTGTETAITLENIRTEVLVTSSVADSKGIPCEWLPQHMPPLMRYNLHWSQDSKILYYTETFELTNWNSYRIEDNQDEKLVRAPEFLLPPDVRQVAMNCSITSYEDIYISPSKDAILYTQRDQNNLRIYLKKNCHDEEIRMGEMYGVIDQWLWLNNGDKILVSMDWQSPLGVTEAYVYLIDLLCDTVSIVIQNSPEYFDTTLLGYTPDENWAMYLVYSDQERNLRFFNINTSESKTSSVPYPPKAYRWISPTKLLAVGPLSAGSPGDSVYVYDYYNDQTQVIFPAAVRPYHGDVQISPDGKSIAYIDADSLETRIISCKIE